MTRKKDGYRRDEDGNLKLRVEELQAIRMLYAVLDSLLRDLPVLEKRLKEETDGGYRYGKLTQAWATKTLTALAQTIPAKQRTTLMAELRSSTFHVRVGDMAATGVPAGCVCVEIDTFARMVDRAIQMDCFSCTKTCREGRRCQLFKDIQAVFPYRVDFGDDSDECTFAGLTHVERE